MLPRLETPELGNGKSIACIAIGYGETGHEEYAQGGYWKGPSETTGPFVDPEPEFKAFILFGTGSLGARGLLSLSTMKAVISGGAPSNPLPSGGNQWNLGGTFLVDLQTGALLFEHRQTGFADHPDLEALLAACNKGLSAQSAEAPSVLGA